MELTEAIRSRRSVRKFTRKEVSQQKIKKLVDAAIMAPSPLNLQPWLFTVVTGKPRDELLGIISRATTVMDDILAVYGLDEKTLPAAKEAALRFYSNLGDAPVIMVASVPSTSHPYLNKMRLAAVAMAFQNLMLTAYASGLGTCCITPAAWIEEEVKKFLKLSDRDVGLMMVLGYPDEKPAPLPRNQEVVRWLGF
jgi:nitroreductase